MELTLILIIIPNIPCQRYEIAVKEFDIPGLIKVSRGVFNSAFQKAGNWHLGAEDALLNGIKEENRRAEDRTKEENKHWLEQQKQEMKILLIV